MSDKNFKVKNGLDVGNNISISDTGTITGLDTDNLPEGTTNVYYTDTRADARVAIGIANLVDSAPATLDTLNELAAALGDDANFATTVSTALGTKLATADFTSTADTWLGTKDTADLAEGTNLYYTTERARSAYTGTGNITVNASTGVISFEGPTGPDTTDELTEGTTNLYFTDTRARSAVDNGVDLDVDGSNNVYVKSLRDETQVLGELLATRNTSFINPPPNTLEVSAQNGFEAVSSAPDTAGPLGYSAGFTATYYHGETDAGNSISPTFTSRVSAGTNAGGGGAIPINTVLGTFNFNGHSGTGFASYVATQNGGGGKQTLNPLQLQGYATQAFAESTISLPTTATVQSNLTIAAVVSSGSGVFTNTSADVRQYDVVRVTGTLTGTMTFPGYVSGNIYYVTAGANPTTTFTLSEIHDGTPVATTAGTTTGLTFVRHRSIITFAAQTFPPFGFGSKVTVAGITPTGYNGTHRAVFGTTTQVGYGNYQTGTTQTVAGTVSMYNVTAGGTGFRVRGFPDNASYNNSNRINFINHNVAACTYRSDSFTWQGGTNTFNYMVMNAAGATFNTGALTVKDLAGTSTYATINSSGLTLGPQGSGNISYNRTFGCFHKIANVTAAAGNTVYNFDWFTDATAHVGNQGVTVASGQPTRLAIDTAGSYEVIIEMQAKNTDVANRTAWIWLAKNGTDLGETRIKMMLRASGVSDEYQFITKAWLANNLVANDYLELRFAVDNPSGISLEYEAAQTSPFAMPAQPSATITIVPVGA